MLALILALVILGGLTAKVATGRSNISLNESALYPEDI